jgi:hypothetical protein
MVQDGKKRTGISLVKVVLSDDDEDKDSYSDVCSNKVYNAAATKPTGFSCRPNKTKKVEDNNNNNKSRFDSSKHARAKKPAPAAAHQKSANSSEDEDNYLIAVSFVHATVDPIRGVCQESEALDSA